MNDSMVPCEQASKQPKGGISSPPANTWIFSRPPLISSVILAIFCAAPCRTSSAGVHVVDIRHWNRCWAITLGASASATAAAPVAIAVFLRKFLRSIASSVSERLARPVASASIAPGPMNQQLRGRRLRDILTLPMTDSRRFFDDIQVGEEYESPGRTVTETDIVIFAGLSGDYNILHTDA